MRKRAFAKPAVDRVPAEIASPAETRRLFNAMLHGIRDSAYGSEIGRLYLVGKLTSAEVSIAKRWCELVTAYSSAMRGPKRPATVLLDDAGGTPSDPSSEIGIKEAKKHERAVANWIEGRDALRKAGRGVEAVVDDVVVHDRARPGFDELAALKAGLHALSSQWSSARKKAAR
jgi:hypothetical protein